MTLIRKLLFISLLSISLNVHAEEVNPFDNGFWKLDDSALHTHKNTRAENSYSIAYNLPDGGRASTDFCSLTSDTLLSCSYTGDQVSYNPVQHSATLKTRFESITFYDPNYPHTSSPLSGRWHKMDAPRWGCKNLGWKTVIIPTTEENTRDFRLTFEFTEWGGGSTDLEVHLVQDPRNGRLTLSRHYTYPVSYYEEEFGLFNKDNQPITDFNKLNTVAILKGAVMGGIGGENPENCIYKKE